MFLCRGLSHSFSAMRHGVASSVNRLSSSVSTSYNTVCKGIIVGRLGNAPILRVFDDGRESLSLSVATNEIIRTGDEYEQRAVWHRVFVSQGVTGFDYIKTLPSGTLVYVEGGLRVRTVDDTNGKMQYVSINVSPREGTVRVLAKRLATQGHEDVPSQHEEDPF